MTILIASLTLNYILVKFKIFHQKNSIIQIQDIHLGNPSRFGGVVITLIFLAYQLFYSELSKYLLACLLLLLTPAFLEDMRIKIKPTIRFLVILSSSLLLIISLPILPIFNFKELDILLNNQIFQIIFFTIAVTTVVNGQNIIDGTNGLSSFASLAIFTSILFLGFYLNDQDIINTSLLIIVLLIGFIAFNYPFGLIFLGDTGCYFLGFLSSYLVIDIFAKYPELPSWSAVIILFYPTLEACFSFFRKISFKNSPFQPDDKHLHLKIYFLISKEKKPRKLHNALVTPFLGIIWLSPLSLLPLSIQHTHWSLLFLSVIVIVYLFFYYAIPEPSKN